MTPVFCCGCECGIASTAGAHWESLASNASFSTTTVRNGARSLRFNLSASTAAAVVNTNLSIGGTVGVLRAYVRFTTLPTVDFGIVQFSTAAGSVVGAVFKSSDSKIYAGRDNSGTLTVGATGVSVTTGQWYLIDILVDVHTNPWTVDVKVDGTACGQASIALAASTIGTIRLGRNYTGTSANIDCFVDDIVASATSGDYPIGAGYVNHFVPTADGTHNIAGTGDFQRTLTGTDILNATTTAFQLVDEVPLEATVTDWINMLAPPNATDYVECVFGPAPGISTPTVAPRAVEVLCGINQSGTGSGNMEIRLNDNGTTNAVYSATGVAGVAVATGQVFKRKHYATAPTGGAWTVSAGAGNFNDLRIRFGSPAALDVNPDQYFGCAMIEAEFLEATATPLTQTAADDANNLADAFTKQLNGSLTQTQADSLTTPTDAMVLGLGLVFAETITVATDGLVVGHGMAFTDNANNLADALNKTIGYEVPLSDNANTLADSEVRQLGTTQTLADTLASLADAYAQLLVYLLALSDTQAANWADAHQLLLAHFLALADTLDSLTDTTVIRMEQREEFTDTLNALSDAVASQLGTALELTDSITVLTDSYTHTLGYSIVSSDTLVITDSLGIGYGLLTSDTIALTDSAVVVMELRLSFSDDTNTLADSAVVQLSQALDLSDSFILVDSQSTVLGFNQLFTDSINNLADAETNVLGQLVQFSDDINLLADARVLALGYALSFSDTVSFSDSAALLLVHLLNLSDDTNFIADSIDTSAPQGPQRQVGVTDSLATFTDEVTLQLDYLLTTSDTITLTDSAAVAQGLLATFADSFTLTDTSASTLGHLVPLSDALTLTDSSQRGLGYETSYSDSLVLTDAATLAEGQRLQLTDNAANWADSVAIALGLGVILADNGVTFSDSLTALLSHLLRLSDSFTLTDALTTFGESYLTISDSFVLTDDVDTELRGPDFNYDFADSLVLSDAIALTLANELQLQLTLTDIITLTDHYFDLRRPYASSAKRHVVVPSRARVTIPTTSRVVVVPAGDRTTEVT